MFYVSFYGVGGISVFVFLACDALVQQTRDASGRNGETPTANGSASAKPTARQAANKHESNRRRGELQMDRGCARTKRTNVERDDLGSLSAYICVNLRLDLFGLSWRQFAARRAVGLAEADPFVVNPFFFVSWVVKVSSFEDLVVPHPAAIRWCSLFWCEL